MQFQRFKSKSPSDSRSSGDSERGLLGVDRLLLLLDRQRYLESNYEMDFPKISDIRKRDFPRDLSTFGWLLGVDRLLLLVVGELLLRLSQHGGEGREDAALRKTQCLVWR